MKKHKLPIEDEVDVISVGTSFERFLEIAEKVKKPVVVVTDNDGDYENNIAKKYKQYEKIPTIKICADNRNDLNTLEPQIIDANQHQIDMLKRVLGLSVEAEKLTSYMQNNKTECALKIFDTAENIKLPQYILNAIEWDYGKE
jgi:putative ATP-dependent endonuclease of OLD family